MPIQEKNPYDIPIVTTFTSVPVKFDDNMLTDFKVALVCLKSLSLMQKIWTIGSFVCYGESVPSNKWSNKFKHGNTCINDTKRFGQLRKVMISESMDDMQRIVLNSQVVKLDEMLTERVRNILSEYLHMKKFFLVAAIRKCFNQSKTATCG